MIRRCVTVEWGVYMHSLWHSWQSGMDTSIEKDTLAMHCSALVSSSSWTIVFSLWSLQMFPFNTHRESHTRWIVSEAGSGVCRPARSASSCWCAPQVKWDGDYVACIWLHFFGALSVVPQEVLRSTWALELVQHFCCCFEHNYVNYRKWWRFILPVLESYSASV